MSQQKRNELNILLAERLFIINKDYAFKVQWTQATEENSKKIAKFFNKQMHDDNFATVDTVDHAYDLFDTRYWPTKEVLKLYKENYNIA